MILIRRLKQLLDNRNTRSFKAKKNILFGFGIKGISIVIGLVLVPITIDYLDTTRYGIWITLSSFLGWFSFFEIGLGTGLKNKLSEALATNNFELGKTYVSTSYFLISIIVFLLLFVFGILAFILDWTIILNAPIEYKNELSILAIIVLFSFSLRFLLRLVESVLFAFQDTALSQTFNPIANIISLFLLIVVMNTINSSLLLVGLIFSLTPIIVLIFPTILLFKGKYSKVSPSLSFIKLSASKELFGISLKFFIIQISTLILFQTSTILIAQYFGPEEVTNYNIVFKYFSVIYMLFTIIVAPLWPAYTEAWVKNDIQWINRILKKTKLIWYAFLFTGVILLVFSKVVYTAWVGDKVQISYELSFWMLLYFLSLSFGGVYNMFINGVGKIHVQMISLGIGAILYLPITIILIKIFHFGTEAVVIGMIFANFYSPFVAPYQSHLIISGKAKGMWNK